MFRRSVSILSCLLIIQVAKGQDKVLERTNTKELMKMHQEFEDAEKVNKIRIEEYAQENGVLINHYLPSGKVISLVGFDEFGKPQYQQTENAKASATISTNRVYPSATTISKYNLAGRSFTVGEWDGGTNRLTHREYEGRAVQADNGTMPLSEHATHVGGTLIAGGISATAKGMAYQAKLLAHDWENDDQEMTVAAAQGLLVSNHSYGTLCGWDFDAGQWTWYGSDAINTSFDYKFGYYDTQARDWDRIAYNAPYYLIVKSAGNSRGSGPGSNPNRPNNGPYDCLPTYSVAKNILTVGAVNPLVNGYTSANAVIISSFSSWGPADDGRIKPDIVGNGVGVISCGIASDNQYVPLDGTSMSGPSVAGSCLLLQEIYSNTHNLQKMKSATLKGLVIHTADECWTAPGPDYRFGWGLMNTRKASDVVLNDKITSQLIEDTMSNQGVNEITVTAIGNAPLVATLCWMDYQGTPGPAAYNSRLRMLVNDLDLRIINQSNQEVSLPWKLVADSAAYAAKRGDNSIDNVEKIELSGATPGQAYKIKVSHKGTLFAGNSQPLIQPYSLIVTGIVAGDTSVTCIPLQYMNAKSGVLDDGSGLSKKYAHNSDCGWVLNPEDSGSIVRMIFRAFNVQAGDTLYAYSGKNSSGQIIGKFSGSQLPDTLFTTSAQAYLNFKSDGSGNSAGWEILYSSMPKPKFDFNPDSKTLCAGNNVSFTVQAQNGPTTDWIYSWNLVGASNTNPTTAAPTVSYTNVGVYSASLTVTNKAGSTTVNKSNLLTVKPQIAPNLPPYFEGFENTTFPNNNTTPTLSWTTTQDANPWTRNTLSPYTGLAAMRIRNATAKKDIRELVSPSFNIENVQANSRYIAFRMAYARINTTLASDQLRVLISTNCGKTWTEVYKRNHSTNPKLSTIGDAASDVVTGTFIPEPFQYRKDSISLNTLPANTQNLVVKFEMTSEKGNFLYLDDFEFCNTTVGIDKLIHSEQLDLLIFPNPTNGNSSIMVKSPLLNPIHLELTDLMGRAISSTVIKQFDSQGTATISSGDVFINIPSGMYLIRVKDSRDEKIIRWIRN